MKFIKYSLLLIISFFSNQVFSQGNGKDPEATKILDKLHNQVSSLNSIQVKFEVSIHDGRTNSDEKISGNAMFKGKKFVIKTNEIREVYNNGITVWDYDGSEVTISEFDEGDEFLSIAKVTGKYKKGYKYHLKDDATISGKNCYVIDLEPDVDEDQRAREQVFKIRLVIDMANTQIVQWQIFEKNGRRYTYNIKEFKSNVSIDDSSFIFNVEKAQNEKHQSKAKKLNKTELTKEEKSENKIEVIDLR